MIERQSFVDITEDSLKDEIENQQPELVPETEDDKLDAEVETFDEGEDPGELFNKQSIELTKHINTALNETSLSLDFVSLLISAVKPNFDKTISPHLMKNVPLGSLTSDRLMKQEGDDKIKQEQAEKDLKIGKAWKLQSLNEIHTLFRQSCTSLTEQVTKERKYWNMINLVLNHDEILFKTRIDGIRSIGVKYGYGDSGSNYYDKGLALLKKDDATGEVNFVPMTSSLRITDKVYKYIRIKILSNFDVDYILTGQSNFDETRSRFQASTHKIINDIEKARYFLFEEDLFYQLTREAKNLINYNVSIISNKIIIEIKNEIIEIESVVFDESNDDDIDYQNINQYSTINNDKCQLILNYLKIMLCCYYNYNLKLKQKMPTSLTKWKQSNTHPLILRPLLGNIRHELNLQNMELILNNLIGKFHDKFTTEAKLLVEKYVNLNSRIDNPFQKSIERPVSSINLIISNHSHQYLNIHLKLTTNETFVNLIIQLNIIKFQSLPNLQDNLDGVNVLQTNFHDFNEIEECLKWSIMNFIQE